MKYTEVTVAELIEQFEPRYVSFCNVECKNYYDTIKLKEKHPDMFVWDDVINMLYIWIKQDEVDTASKETDDVFKDIFKVFQASFCKYAIENRSIYYKDIALNICNFEDEQKIEFIKYLSENWKAYVNDVISKTYDYINLTEMVWDSWIDYLER